MPSSTGTAEEPRFETGSILAGRYRIVSVLGRGGMGEVYRADDLKLGCPVALKFLPEGLKRHDHRLAMLLDEARMARTVSHPNVCRVHDVDVHRQEDGNEVHFVSMEYIDGEDLASLLRRIGRLPQAKALDVATELCAGLAAVHACGLLHRDLKPGNVMLDGQGRVRLTDFGLAITASETASLAGTPAYMAPEQLTSRLTTVRSDVYALGLVLYEIFTGQRAFQGTSPREIAWNRLQTSPQAPSCLVEHLPADLDGLIRSCLEKVPERRIPSVDAVATALVRIAGGDSGDEASLSQHGKMLRALLACELICEERSNDANEDPGAKTQRARSKNVAEKLQKRYQGQEVRTTKGLLLLFERPSQALLFALDYHGELDQLSQDEQVDIQARIGIHFGEVLLLESSSADTSLNETPIELADGPTHSLAKHLMALAERDQILLSGGAFDLARRASTDLEDADDLRWLDYGSWGLDGFADPIDICEVGYEGRAPLKPPAESQHIRRLLMQSRIEGWRPAPGLHVPGRPYWQIEERLGEGGFGEAWLVRHAKTNEPRCFKFCFDAERLRALQREITLFRLLKEELGDRKDINRLLDWNLDEAPYFIESEYTHIGDLTQWARNEGGLGQIPLEVRLDIVAQVAEALAAAHSVGVLHKDVKPSNILIRHDPDGRAQAQLADFGVGQVTERERLAAAGITVLGLSRRTGEDTTSSQAGTPLYLAPELLEGRVPTLQSDIYSLGVLLYQLVVGDFGRALAPGWRREIGDELLAEDIGSFADGTPERRPAHANEVAHRLKRLEERRLEHQAAMAAKQALEASQRRRRVYKAVAITSVIALVAVSTLAIWALRAGREERRAHKTTEEVLDHMIGVFDIANPYSTETPGEKRGETATALELLNRGTERVETEFVDEPLIRARLTATYGRIYSALGLYEKAQALQEQALTTRTRYLGSRHPDTLQTMNELGVTLRGNGQYDRSCELLTRTLELRKQVLGTEDPATLRSMHNLANTLQALGELENAKNVRQENLEIMTRVLGDKHPHTLTSMYSLASTLQDLGEFEEAKNIHQTTLETRTHVLGDEHPDTLGSMHQLATTLQDLGEFEEAKNIYQKNLEITSRVLGEEHPQTLISMNNLAATLQDLGELKNAKNIHQEVLEIKARVLGEEHPQTLTTMHNLATVLQALGQVEEAKNIHQKNLEITTRVLGEEHPQTLISMHNLASALQDLGELENAKNIHQEVLEITIRILGDEHPATFWSMSSLANDFHFLGEFVESRRLNERLLEVQLRKLGAKHPSTLMTQGNLALNFIEMGEYHESAQLMKNTADISTRFLGEQHRITLHAKHMLALSQSHQGLHEQAEKLQRKLLIASQEALGTTHRDSLAFLKNLGEVIARRGDWAQAKPLQEEALDAYEKVFSVDHPTTQEVRLELSSTLLRLGEGERAKQLALAAQEVLDAKLSPRHPLATEAARRLLEIAQEENDANGVHHWIQELRWLTETDEADIESAQQRETRRYVLEVMDELKIAA